MDSAINGDELYAGIMTDTIGVLELSTVLPPLQFYDLDYSF